MRRPLGCMCFVLLWLFAAPALAAADNVPPVRPEDKVTVLGVMPKTISPTELRVNPRIPPGVTVHGQEGWVHLKLQLSPSGNVTDATIVESYPKGVFDPQVMDVVHGWQFKPPVTDGVYDVAVAFYMNAHERKRGHSFGYRAGTERGVRGFYFTNFQYLTFDLDRHDLDDAGKRIKVFRDAYQAGKLEVTEIVRTYVMLTRYLRMTDHCDLALNEARRALLLARFMDNGRMVYGVHLEVMSCLLTLGRNDDAVDYYDSWRKVGREGMSKSGVAIMEDLRAKGFGKGRVFSIIDFYDSNYQQAINMDSTLQVAVEVLSIAFPAPPDAPSLLD